MRLFQLIKQRWTSQSTLPLIADDIAERCLEAVWQRVQHRVATLAPGEARGYIRARGVAVIQPRLASAAAQYEVLDHHHPQLHALAIESLIRRVQERVRKQIGQRQSRRAA